MARKIKVWYIATECKPFAPTGGIAVVANELPPALKKAGVDISRVIPQYGIIDRKFIGKTSDCYSVCFESKSEDIRINEGTYFDDVRNIFVQSPPFFEGGYSNPYTDKITDIRRFSFFAKALLPLIGKEKPDIIHINDWMLGYLPAFMELDSMKHKTVTTIHNSGYQGDAPKSMFSGTAIARIINDQHLGRWFEMGHDINSLKLAMELSAKVNTVSPTYAREMMEHEDQSRYFEGGKGLENIARRLYREGRFTGILNGYVYKTEANTANFLKLLEQKEEMKISLSQFFANPKNFLIGFVGRAVEQKFKLLAEQIDGKSVLEHILDIPGVNLAILATGQHEYEDYLRWLHSQNRNNLLVIIKYDPDMAHTINMASDLALMPSLYEPCGIVQLEAKDRGTIPLVRATGGLKDTVFHYTEENGTGFCFDGLTRDEVLRNQIIAVKEAYVMYLNDPGGYKELQRRTYFDRYNWDTSAQRYVEEMYEPLMD